MSFASGYFLSRSCLISVTESPPKRVVRTALLRHREAFEDRVVEEVGKLSSKSGPTSSNRGVNSNNIIASLAKAGVGGGDRKKTGRPFFEPFSALPTTSSAAGYLCWLSRWPFFSSAHKGRLIPQKWHTRAACLADGTVCWLIYYIILRLI